MTKIFFMVANDERKYEEEKCDYPRISNIYPSLSQRVYKINFLNTRHTLYFREREYFLKSDLVIEFSPYRGVTSSLENRVSLENSHSFSTTHLSSPLRRPPLPPQWYLRSPGGQTGNRYTSARNSPRETALGRAVSPRGNFQQQFRPGSHGTIPPRPSPPPPPYPSRTAVSRARSKKKKTSPSLAAQ